VSVSREERTLLLYAEYRDDPAFEELRTNGNPFVPGDGSLRAEVLFIGEAPGREEALAQRPFVGRSGKLLEEMIQHADLMRAEVRITNLVKYRPPDNDLDPFPREVNASKPYLRREAAILAPRVVVPVGRYALEVVRPGERITKAHGIPSRRPGRSAWILPIFHPAYILRTRNRDATVMTTYKAAFDVLRELLNSKQG
jgi:uracil-DNA glycosylase family 4